MKHIFKLSLLSLFLLTSCNNSPKEEFVKLDLKTLEETGEVFGTGTYLKGSQVSILAIPNEFYSFIGWYEKDTLISKETKYTFNILENLEYTAVFQNDVVSLELYSNNDLNYHLNGSGKYYINEEVTISAIIEEGYVFDGWYIDNRLLSRNNPYTLNINENKRIEARFISLEHEVFVSVNDTSLGEVKGSGNYRYKDLVTLTASSKEDALFLGYYDEEDNLLCSESIYRFVMENSSYIIKAKFEKIKHKITVDIYNNKAKKYTSRIGEVNFKVDNKILDDINETYISNNATVTLLPKEKRGFVFSCWVNKNVSPNVMTFDKELVIESIKSDLNYECRFTAIEEWDSISIGSYPQSLVPNYEEELLSSLTSYIKEVPTKENSNNWTPYIDTDNQNNHFMFYKDITHNYETYRAVYLLDYRNSYLNIEQDDNFNQSLNGFNLNTAYFFKFEPISWNVIKSTNGEILSLQSDLILDSQPFNHPTTIKENIYPSNYKESYIRSWLNTSFFNLAISEEEYIVDSLIKNDYISAGVSNDFVYTCDDTRDYISLLSQQEANVLDGVDRRFFSTDYAKIMGLEVTSIMSNLRSPWLLRSPTSDNEDKVRYVLEDGSTIGKSNVYYTGLGIVPCISLDISIF